MDRKHQLAVRMASEDIGLADPRALEQALAARAAVEALGMPEAALSDRAEARPARDQAAGLNQPPDQVAA